VSYLLIVRFKLFDYVQVSHCTTGLICLSIQAVQSQIRLADLFYGKASYTYFVGSVEPGSGWNQPGFNDISWMTGYKSIGYGDGDDSTVIDKTTSVYIRIPFYLEDKKPVWKGQPDVDFDDGLLPIQRERDRPGKPGDWGNYSAWPVKPTVLMKLISIVGIFHLYAVLSWYGHSFKILINGENILAFQVHNDSLDGSDLSFKVRLMDITNAFYNMYLDQSRYIKQVAIDSTSFPLLLSIPMKTVCGHTIYGIKPGWGLLMAKSTNHPMLFRV